MAKKVSGVPASGGLAIGRALLWKGGDSPEVPRYKIKSSMVDKEWGRLQAALDSLYKEKNEQLDSIEKEKNKAQQGILRAHILMLTDADFHEQMKNALEKQLENIEWIVWSISHKLVQTLLASPNAQLRERAGDISDVSHSILNKLLAVTQVSLSNLTEDCIVVAHDIPPSAALTIDKKHIKAIAIDAGSATSHTAILARSFQMPAVVGLSCASQFINSGDVIIVDGNSGCVIINPNEKTLLQYQNEMDLYEKKPSAKLILPV
ncbi:hypothetical protein FACS189494_11820 [Spirochaetia bacterium]|nr:hypothetical protein FACS189494_11820 [Spirochaetia bacterium]